jgi:hypothetical protein
MQQVIAHLKTQPRNLVSTRVAAEADDLFGKGPVWFSMASKLIRFVAIDPSILPDIPMKGALCMYGG